MLVFSIFSGNSANCRPTPHSRKHIPGLDFYSDGDDDNVAITITITITMTITCFTIISHLPPPPLSHSRPDFNNAAKMWQTWDSPQSGGGSPLLKPEHDDNCADCLSLGMTKIMFVTWKPEYGNLCIAKFPATAVALGWYRLMVATIVIAAIIIITSHCHGDSND